MRVNAERRDRLQQQAGRRLVAAFQRVVKRPDVQVFEVEMFWPPDSDGIHFLAQADKKEIGWDFRIPAANWRLEGDCGDRAPAGLYSDILHLFRLAWREATAAAPAVRAYLRFHDSTSSTDLRTGRVVDDRDRPDYEEPARPPFETKGRSTPKRRRDGELIRRGDPVARVKSVFRTNEDPHPTHSQYFWPERGIRIAIKGGKVDHVVYFAPFSSTIGGIWVGAYAWEVDAILGRAKAEFLSSSGRLWQYDVNGFMSIGFDRDDRVRTIGR